MALPTYGLVFDATGSESDATNIGMEETAVTGPRDLDGWWQLQDDNGIKAYFGDQELAAFVQRVVDPTRWKYLTDEDKALLRAALAS